MLQQEANGHIRTCRLCLV